MSFNYLELIKPKYDFIVVDEVQDITNIQLKLILSSLKNQYNFIISGDSNQIVHPNFFSWSKTKTMFFQTNMDFTLLRVLNTNYRNSQRITEISNTLLKIKNVRFGSIDKESNYLINSISKNSGDIIFLKDDDSNKKELNSRTHRSTKFAVLVMNNDDKKYARQFFKTPLIFSIHEAKGLEYENVILLNFVSDHDKEFHEISKGLDPNDLTDELRYSRARDKEDKDLEVYKFFINSLYVAFTRSVKNLYIIEKKQKHRIFELLSLKEINEKIDIEDQKSTEEDWLQEAQKLEMQGKYEQAQEIRDKLAGIDNISLEDLKKLELVALDPNKKEHEIKSERKRLFKYAVARSKIETIDALAKLNFPRAIRYIKELRMAQKEFVKSCRLDRTDQFHNVIKQYGVDFRSNENNMTGLMLSCHHGAIESLKFFLGYKADIKLKDSQGLNALNIVLKNYRKNKLTNYSNNGNNKSPDILKYYNTLRPISIRCKVDDKIIKLGSHSMEYFLINYLIAVQQDIIDEKQKKVEKIIISMKKFSKIGNYSVFHENMPFPEYNCLKIDEFMEFIEKMPEYILPEYRRRRSYVNSILANNEINRDFIYNKKLFKRIVRGGYIFNPDLMVIEAYCIKLVIFCAILLPIIFAFH